MTVVISYLGQLHGHIAGADPAQNLNVAQRWRYLKWRHMSSRHITIHDVIYLFIDKTKWNWTVQISSTLSNSSSIFMGRSLCKFLHITKCFQESRRDFCCITNKIWLVKIWSIWLVTQTRDIPWYNHNHDKFHVYDKMSKQ